ncbi:MAG TPA: cobalamin-dependent protein [Elusimicrobiota bacterium]|nr:cobalamin-dependent protein [Elusimicrobiota bacterium]
MPFQVVLANFPDHIGSSGSLASGCLRSWALADPDLAQRVSIDYCDIPTGEDPMLAARRMAKRAPRVAGLSCYVWNLRQSLKLAVALKELLPDIRIVLGGPEAAGMARDLLESEPAVDFVALSEGEETFRRLLLFLAAERGQVDEVPGLAFRKGSAVAATPEAPLIDVCKLGAPYAAGHVAMPKWAPNALFLEASRGCPFSCAYCDWGPKRMRYRAVEDVEADLRAMADKTPLVHCIDADVLMNRRKALPILEAFLRATEGHATKLGFGANPMHLWPEVVDFFSRHQDRFIVGFGLQTVVPEVAKSIQRPLDIPVLERRMRHFKEKCPSMQFTFDLMFGLPGDDLGGFKRSLEWTLGYRPSVLFTNHCIVLPGSELERRAKEQGLIYQKEPMHQMVETPTMSREDFGVAHRLGVLVHFLGYSRNQAIYDELYGLMERRAGEGGTRVETLERWAQFLTGLGLSFGLDDDDRENSEVAARAWRRLKKDPLLLAALMKATRDFAAQELAGEAVSA